MQSRTACSEECAIILFCCLFHFTYSSTSSSLSICHWIIARLCMHSRQLFSKSNCPAINPQIVSQNQWERSRSLTSQPLALNCYLLSPFVIYNASTAHLHTGEITGLSRSHSPPSINASHTVVAAEDPLTQWLTFPKNRFACHNVLITEESHLDCCCALWQRRQWSICISFSRIFLASYLHVDDGCTSRSSQKLNPLIF